MSARTQITRELRDVCDRGVGADEEIRQYPGAATSLSHENAETRYRRDAAHGISISLSPDISENPVSFLDTRETDRELGVH